MRLKHPFLAGMLTTLAFLLGVEQVKTHCMWNISPSMPRGLYWQTANPQVAVNDLVIFTAPDSWIAALPEATRHIPLLKRVHAVMPEAILVEGEHPQSMDSRHYGPIPRIRIIGQAMPLLTW